MSAAQTNANEVPSQAPGDQQNGSIEGRSDSPACAPLDSQSAPPAASESELPNTPKRKNTEPYFDENKISDTKIFFDSLRNMGICIAMLAGLPTFYKITEYAPVELQWVFGIATITAAGLLAALNLKWTFSSLKEKSALWANLSTIAFGLIVVSAFVVDAISKLPRL